MNIYELSLGFTKHFVAATDEQHAYEQGTDAERFPDIHYLPFNITQVMIPGHTISVTKDDSDEPEQNTTSRRGRRAAT